MQIYAKQCMIHNTIDDRQLVLAEPPISCFNLADPLRHGGGQLGTQFRGHDVVPGFLDFLDEHSSPLAVDLPQIGLDYAPNILNRIEICGKV